ncbi:hypothetical protein [Caulobacter mirabilis]|uniref:Uncharacterized protein n=1 Tax=Caulobacter mirabilis TaxID=69666 RepID=A0A2D2AUG8_9CAUL|nr:hypothetical protein [Caulobacter mirabilis]ATQ41649.1 hypothetical protein CSW64_04085 [Caulobacter mirabilis]
MSAFEFFFSFYGLLLGLSVAVVATGVATAVQHRRKIRIGWLTPLLALFIGLDIASFWDSAWTNFRHLPFSYGLLVVGLAIATVYFVAASLVFPHQIEDGMSLDDHFWANKRVVILLLVTANLLSVGVLLAVNLNREGGVGLATAYGVTVGLYLLLVLPAAFTRRAWLFGALIGLHTAVYLTIAVMSGLNPTPIVSEEGKVVNQPALSLPRR